MADELVWALRAAGGRVDRGSHRAVLLDPASDRDRLEELARDPAAVVIDTVPEQLDELMRSRAPAWQPGRVDALLEGSPPELFGRWVLYPWSGRLVHVLPEPLHRELRLDRNRYKITAAEQAELRIAVAGLSVGRAVSSTLVREGLCGEIRLADFDALSLSNLNRVTGGIADIGVNKAVLAAREVAELDPYLRVVVHDDGVQEDSLEAFLAGVDIVLDECDDLAMKLLLRERARAARVPVVMVTSDRGLLDVERFDREPGREPFHGVLAGLRAIDLRRLTTKQKVPYVLRIIDAERMQPRLAASLVEVGQTLSTWPQLASDVALGGAMAANAVRRIALGELVTSGRYEVDLDVLVRDGFARPAPPVRSWVLKPAGVAAPELPMPAPGDSALPTREEMRFVVGCATLAPSGGNAQPWRFTCRGATLVGTVDRTRTSLLDVEGWAGCLALGAALEAALIGARALGFAAQPVVHSEPGASRWEVTLQRAGAPAATPELTLLRERCCNRVRLPSPPIPPEALVGLVASAGSLQVLTVVEPALGRLGEALAELDRVRVLSPAFHRELFSEIRWSRDEALATRDGLDVAALEFDAADLAVLEVIRSAPTAEVLGGLGLGGALGAGSRTAFCNAGAALVIGVRFTEYACLVEAGRDLLRLWLDATARGVGVHPWGSPLLYQRLRETGSSLDAWQRDAIAHSRKIFAEAAPVKDDVAVLLVLRLTTGTQPTARSVRRPVDDVLSFTDGV
ncbi:MAG TPA: Rv1355c family protein [Pseudonocardiaceae bacterium]|nr:Rv1355c family protein [Pseudonocardiaceae bacterium]